MTPAPKEVLVAERFPAQAATGCAPRRSAGVRFFGCRRGAAAIEFALVATPLFALLIGILQIGVVFLAQQQLETAVEKSARTVLTGSAQKSGLTQAQFASALCANLTVLFSCSQVMVDLRSASAFSAADTSAPTLTYDASGNVTNSWSFDMGSAGAVMVLRVMYQFPVVGGPLNVSLANLGNGKRLLMATAVFQVEPYS
ncbi:TadE/TadG family type IV pilus assembly protein [Methylosinus sp. Sm6]|uniref:TadE/TadG family type IV pilus assembly protein n=1 Tax=Methylosinus sp. Sm6 TaxID=2866948 RepID=UPI001C9925EA|nr:TadE/TadG family type IV pilus assembly protein [Methylosinus sp. Sm6]MBY6239864.1 pilus assembly protein [Methylosinus sp. Sm6]